MYQKIVWIIFNISYPLLLFGIGARSVLPKSNKYLYHRFKAIQKTLLLVGPYLRPGSEITSQLNFYGACICLLITRVLNCLLPIQLSQTLSHFAAAEFDQQQSLKCLGILLFMHFLRSSAGIHMLVTYLWLQTDAEATENLSCAVYNHFMSLSSDFHDRSTTSDLWLLARQGTSMVAFRQTVLRELISTMLDLLIAPAFLASFFDYLLAVVATFLTALYIWLSSKSAHKRADAQRQFMSKREIEQRVLSESSLNWSTVSYFNRIRYEMDRYRTAVQDTQKSYLAFATIVMIFDASREAVILVGLLATLLMRIYQLPTSAYQTSGDLLMFSAYWSQLTKPLHQLSGILVRLTQYLSDSERLGSLLSEKPKVCDSKDAVPLHLKRGEIEFREVDFSYDSHRKVLQNISFRLGGGNVIAIVGETGSGKSTLLKLLFRLYDPTNGQILVDGQDIRHVKLESLQKVVGVVPQDVALFNCSIAENLQYANPLLPWEKCQKACVAADVHDAITAMSQGYETVVGERGARLSGGEAQRVALARLFIKDPKIGLVDEPTSSVDSGTEERILASLANWRQERTVIIVSHRLSMVKEADQILVLEAGRLVESRCHGELLQAKGHYFRLWNRNSSS